MEREKFRYSRTVIFRSFSFDISVISLSYKLYNRFVFHRRDYTVGYSVKIHRNSSESFTDSIVEIRVLEFISCVSFEFDEYATCQGLKFDRRVSRLPRENVIAKFPKRPSPCCLSPGGVIHARHTCHPNAVSDP